MKSTLNEIIKLTQTAGTLPFATAVPRLSMIKGDVPASQLAALYKPMIGFTVQGAKLLSLGDTTTTLKGPSYFVLPMHVPATAVVRPTSDGRPYTSLGLELNLEALQSLLRDLPLERLPRTAQSFAACEFTPEHMQAWLRLLRLTTTPQDIAALAPAYEREILYWILTGPQGWYLRQLGMKESRFAKIAKIIQWLRASYAQTLDVSVVAKRSGMATNTFHRHFKQATGLSPIQFQKRLRLLEARSLIAFEGYTVAGAAFQVGYQSPSQFNREYSRFFGATPARDTEALRRLDL